MDMAQSSLTCTATDIASQKFLQSHRSTTRSPSFHHATASDAFLSTRGLYEAIASRIQMPNNTWLTPYKLPPSTCLSIGPSQGVVYQLCDEAVVKVPFQYPVVRMLPEDETNEQIYMSFRSFALYNKESAFYAMLSKNQHPNLLQRLQSNTIFGIVLPRLRSLEQVWGLQTKETHFTWIQQLLAALGWLEELGYTHGDLKVQNMGIDDHNHLKIFDFGAIRHCNDEDFDEQVLEDHFALATCIHFLASGVDPFAKANSRTEVQQTFSTLRGGQGIVDEAAKDFEKIIQAGWTGAVSKFASVPKPVSGTRSNDQPTESFSEAFIVLDHLVLEEDPRWMNEEAYRAAWEAAGYEVPDDIWS
jgi:serine/threonine protein kinase